MQETFLLGSGVPWFQNCRACYNSDRVWRH